MFGDRTSSPHAALSGRRVGIVFITLLVCVLAMAAIAPGANAAETTGAGYGWTPLRYPDGSTYRCSGWSGGTDASGNFYLPCGRWIYKLDQNGRYLQAIEVPSGFTAYRDVAANTQGTAIYFTSGPSGGFDQPNPAINPGVGQIVKMSLGTDGRYHHVPSFRVGPFALGASYWSARNIDIDLQGRLYVSVNAYIYVFDKFGRRLQVFGGDIPAPGTAYNGWLEVPQGVAVTPSGNTLYVVEQRHNHVQRWYRDQRGDWHRSTSWYLGSLTQPTDCVNYARFASPYDVALDGAGNIYVLDVTCRRIQKFSVASRGFRGSIWRNYPVGDGEQLFHGFAINYRGSVIMPDQGRRYVLNQAQTACAPDSAPPSIGRIAIRRRAGANVTFSIRASDRCSRVTQMQFVGPTLKQSWRSFSSTPTITVTGGKGYKSYKLSVSDAYGHTATKYFTMYHSGASS